MISTRVRLIVFNLAGTIYTILTIFVISFINLYFTCPDIYEDCHWPTVNAILILVQISVNLFLFHYYNRRNQVQYWTAKSVWLHADPNFLEKKTRAALNGPTIGNNFDLKLKQPKSLDQNSVHEMKSFTKYAICQDGTYVDLKSEIFHSTSEDIDEQTEKAATFTKFCQECKMITPRRSQHCPLCNICVLRKDHHCFLLGACAGLANQRYFIVFLFWAAIGASYGTIFNFFYLNKHVAPWFPFGWVFYLGPVALFRWFLGYETLFNALLGMLFSISFASSFTAIGFFFLQMTYTLAGMTMYDFHRAVRTVERDGDNYQERLALVFGRRWYMNFIIPQFWAPNQMNEKTAKSIFLSVSKDL